MSHITAGKICGRFFTENLQTQTPDATPVTLFSIPLEDGKTYDFEARVQAVKTDGSGGTVFRIFTGFYRNGGGATRIDAIPPADFLLKTLAASPWTAVFTANGNNVDLTLTGTAIETINWNGNIIYSSV